MTLAAPAGWYPDPSGAAGERWWDGLGWSATVRAVPQPVAATAPVGATIPPQSAVAAAASAGPAVLPQPSIGGYAAAPSGHRQFGASTTNRYALITIAVVVLYIVIAVETRFVVFGFLPLGLSLRSKRAGEPLAPFAIGAACLSIAIAAVLIFGR